MTAIVFTIICIIVKSYNDTPQFIAASNILYYIDQRHSKIEPLYWWSTEHKTRTRTISVNGVPREVMYVGPGIEYATPDKYEYFADPSEFPTVRSIEWHNANIKQAEADEMKRLELL